MRSGHWKGPAVQRCQNRMSGAVSGWRVSMRIAGGDRHDLVLESLALNLNPARRVPAGRWRSRIWISCLVVRGRQPVSSRAGGTLHGRGACLAAGDLLKPAGIRSSWGSATMSRPAAVVRMPLLSSWRQSVAVAVRSPLVHLTATGIRGNTRFAFTAARSGPRDAATSSTPVTRARKTTMQIAE